jgi:VWFA-related protein
MRLLATALTMLLLPVHVPAQTPPADQTQPPTFRTTVDLVPVDVSIIDRTGRPVTGLLAEDFVLTVDRQPRRVVSAQYVASVRDVEAVAEAPTHYTSNTASSGGRMIMLVVDQGNIGSGRGRVALESARKFVSSLSPADRVGLVTLPGAGPQIDFTANHALVETMLSRIVGQESGYPSAYRIGLMEAAEIYRGNQMILSEVINRECSALRNVELEICRRQLASDALAVYSMGRERARASMDSLKRLIDRMSLTPSLKTLVYISEGLLLDRDLGDVSWLGPAASRAQVVLYVLQLETPLFDASTARPSPTATQDRALGEEGLGMIAGLTRGTVMRVVSTGEAAFDRLNRELAGYYILSFEPEPGDRDGKPHKIAVTTPNRSGITIRARREFVVGESRMRTAEDLLAETLRAPLLSSDIGLKLATYTLREPGSNKLRIVFGTEIDRSRNATDRISVASVLLDAKGRLVASQVEKDVSTPIRAATRTQHHVGSLAADAPGLYTLKVAVVDSRGTRGSVEHTFRAQLATAGQIRVTDLLIGERGTGPAGRVLPAVAGEFSADVLHGYVELYSDAEEALANTTVVMEVSTSEEGRTLDSGEARLLPHDGAPGRRTAEAVVPIALLPPGDYIARAVISVDGRKAGQVSRPFRIPETRSTANTAAPDSLGPRRAPIPFASRIDAFDRRAVLAPPVVGFFMERMNFGPGGEPGAAAAIEHARAGRFEDAIAALSSSEKKQVATVFLTGLALYEKGDLDAAATKFREAIRLDFEFFPAIFYLGSCYAAGGRDRQAVGAWQTALITESEAPFIYTLLADAFLRLREVQPALDILKEAQAMWPESDQVQLRVGTALAMAGKAREALDVLEPYIARNPSDHERMFIALRALYDSRSKGSSVRTPTEDRALFATLAEAYKTAGGPQIALVDEWRKVVDRDRN